MSNASYKVVDGSPKGTTFKVSPASAPLPMFNIACMMPIALVGLVELTQNFVIGLLILSLPALFVWWVWSKNSKLRNPMAFEVGRDAIISGSSTISTTQVHRLILRNHVTEQEVAPQIGSQTAVIINAPGAVHAGIAQGLTNMGAVAGNAWHRKRARVSWRLDVEAGGRATTLGCGMDETTAYGLLQEANSRLRVPA